MFNTNYYATWNNRQLARRFPVKRLNINGIPEMRTISVTTSGTVVTYQLCPWRFKQLCNEGLMLLRIAQIPPTGSDAFTVALETQSNPQTGSTGTPLVDGVGEPMVSSRVVNGNYLLVYFNKCQGIFQVVNDIPAAAAAATA